jgi:TetR/AcrR family transcriptional regulator
LRPLPTSLSEKLAPSAALFAEAGLDGTTMEDIARVTGISKTTLYYYFEGKEDLFARLLADGLLAVEHEVSQALQGERTAAQQLAAVIEAQVTVMNRNPEVARAMFSELARAERIPEIAAAVDAAYYAPVLRLLAAGAADRSIRDVPDVRETVMAIFGSVAITGLHYLVRDGQIPPGTGGRIARLILHGIAGDQE